MALSESRFMSKNEAKSTFLPSAKIPLVNRANQGVVSGFKQMTWSGAVFTIIFGTKKRNNTFYQAWRNNSCNSQLNRRLRFLFLFWHRRIAKYKIRLNLLKQICNGW